MTAQAVSVEKRAPRNVALFGGLDDVPTSRKGFSTQFSEKKRSPETGFLSLSLSREIGNRVLETVHGQIALKKFKPEVEVLAEGEINNVTDISGRPNVPRAKMFSTE